MEHENKVVVDLDKCLRPIKQKAYSTMCNMRKQDLIDYIRELEHNYNVAIAYNEQQAQNFEMLLKEQEEKRLQLPKEDAEGIKDMLRWEKTNPMPRNRERRYITDFECAVWLTNKSAKWQFHRLNENYQRPVFKHSVVSGAEKIHPTQKPVRLMEEIVMIHSSPDAVVLDPFMGSGSTGVACVNTGRNFIGTERDEKYFGIAKKRIEEAWNRRTGDGNG